MKKLMLVILTIASSTAFAENKQEYMVDCMPKARKVCAIYCLARDMGTKVECTDFCYSTPQGDDQAYNACEHLWKKGKKL